MAWLVALALAVPPISAQAQSGEDALQALTLRLEALERRLGQSTNEQATGNSPPASDLDQRLRILERKLELQADEAAAKTASTPIVSASIAKGLSIKSPPPDGLEIKLKGLVQADGRFFIGDEQVPQNDGFLFRRIRPTLEGTWGSLLGFRLTPEFAGDSASIVDAYMDVKFDPRATLRIGKVKGPIGLERLQSGGATSLVERGFPTELAPNRDIGVQLQGEFLSSALSYVLGIYNGAPDGRDSAASNPDNEFEYAARVFWEPFKNDATAWSGLGLGIAASTGDKFGAGNNLLPRYRTPGQTQFFGYGANVVADGRHRRWSPQGYFYRGRFGVLAEYIASEQTLRIANGSNIGRRASLEHDAQQVTASYVLSGEDASYRGVVRPNQSFTSDGAGWGAFELVARYQELDIDNDAFPLFASAATAASRARSWALGVNWYLTGNFKLVANYSHTRFEQGALVGDREDEKAFFTRAQFSF